MLSETPPAIDEALAVVREVLGMDVAYLRSLIGTFINDPDDVEARSMLAFSLAIGNHFIAAGHGGRRRADVLDSAVQRLLA